MLFALFFCFSLKYNSFFYLFMVSDSQLFFQLGATLPTMTASSTTTTTNNNSNKSWCKNISSSNLAFRVLYLVIYFGIFNCLRIGFSPKQPSFPSPHIDFFTTTFNLFTSFEKIIICWSLLYKLKHNQLHEHIKKDCVQAKYRW